MENDRLKNRLTHYLLPAGVLLVLVFLFFRYVLSLILPFVIAFALAMTIKAPVDILSRRIGGGRRILSAVFVCLCVLLFGSVTFFAANRIVTEIGRFASAASGSSDELISSFFGYIDALSDKLPFIEAVGGDLSGAVSDAVNSMISSLTAKLPQMAAAVIRSLPEILLFTVIIIMASYYFCADHDKNAELLGRLLPPGFMNYLRTLRGRLADTGIKYLRACVILLFITYAELLVGFLMLDIPYAFTLALIIAAVDMLPILGAGTVLIPWALWEWIGRNTYLALGLIVINLTVTVVRRFVEPRIISSGIGLSPLLTLFSMYIGFRLFGFTGLFFSPLFAVMILHMLPDEVAAKVGLRRGEKNE